MLSVNQSAEIYVCLLLCVVHLIHLGISTGTNLRIFIALFLKNFLALWDPQGEQFWSLGGNNRNIQFALDCDSMYKSKVGRSSLRTKFTPFPLFYAQIRYTKLLYSVSRNNLIPAVDSQRIELTEFKTKMRKVFEALCVSLMYGSNVNYFVMGGDVGKVCNGEQQVKMHLFVFVFSLSSQRCSQKRSTSLFAFINRKRYANFLSVPLGLLFSQSIQDLK